MIDIGCRRLVGLLSRVQGRLVLLYDHGESRVDVELRDRIALFKQQQELEREREFIGRGAAA